MGPRQTEPRVLVLSMRAIHDLVAYCAPYELEDVIGEVTGAERVEPRDEALLERARRAYRLARALSGSPLRARALAPRARSLSLSGDYDLFVAVFNNPYELFTLNAIRDWRERCRVAACFVSEMWLPELPEYLLELLAGFDHVFLGVQHPVDEVSRIVGRPCRYLPLAVDVLRFAPLPDPPRRAIDVCYIGRRSPQTHAALLQLARERRLFYYYDTVRASGANGKQMTFRVENPGEHRLLLASLLQRTRYFVANRARVNEPEETAGRHEISARFYEGAAAGTVLVGEAPRCEQFRQQFSWPDALVPMPFDAPDVGRVLAELDVDPERLERIRRENIQQAALRHDWLHRIRTIFDAAGLSATEAMRAREEALSAVAAAARDARPGTLGDGTERRRAEALGRLLAD